MQRRGDRGRVGAWVMDLDTALALRRDRLLTSSLRFEPSFKHEAVDDPDFDPDCIVRGGTDTKKARKVANFVFDRLLPLSLSVDETRLAVALGRITVARNGEAKLVSPESSSDPRTAAQEVEDERAAIFREMYSFGWTMVDGLKFGVDFLAYVGDPLRTHADLMILIRPLTGANALPMLEATLLTTIAAKTRKNLVLASRTAHGQVVFTQMARQPVNLPRFAGRGAPTEEDRLLDEVPQSVEDIKVEEPV